MALEELTDARLLIIASVEQIGETPFNVIVVHDGRQIVDEVITKYENAEDTLYKISELVEQYSPYSKGLCELETDSKDLIKLAASIVGVSVRPKRRQDIEVFVRRTLESYMRDEIFSEPIEEPKEQRSKLRTWIINVLQNTLNKLQGERRP
jgi:hypothetical protein